MSIEPKAIAIGLTGPFGSGSTTAAKIISEQKGCHSFALSEIIHDERRRLFPRQRFTRSRLQALGNQIRQSTKNPGEVAARAISRLDGDRTQHSALVFDGIRNLGEIETLRRHFGERFYLIALECPTSERWERIRVSQYENRGRGLSDFLLEDQRDRDEEHALGQQVQLCVDGADVLLNNDDGVPTATLKKKLLEYINVLTGDVPRYARPEEILMNLAFSAAHGSKCLKRQVGAVIVEAPPGEYGQVVGQGFNENPIGTPPCVEEPAYRLDDSNGPGQCFRDISRYGRFVELAEARTRCPSCGARLETPTNRVPPWNCAKCGASLEHFFWPERAMTLCTAVHAEVAALLAAGPRARGATLYTTTFPCFQCAQKLAHVGIKYVVYTEPYVDLEAAERLEIADVEVARFEGVRSRRFDEIFSRARPYVSDQLAVWSRSQTG